MGALKYDINPLHYVRHSTVPYNVQISSPASNKLLYHVPGAAEDKQIAERVSVNVKSAGSLDLDRVKLYLFDKSASTTTYSDANLASQIIYGGLPPNLPLSSPSPSSIINSTPNVRGSFTRTGIDPKTTDAGNDDFYFIGFNTRRNASGSGDALVSSKSKFPDGEYALVAMAERAGKDSEDVFYSTTPVLVGIDNFRPYLEEVRVMAKNLPGAPVVRQHARLLENNLLVSSEPLKGWLVPGEYTLSATFSEEMSDQVYLGIEGKGALQNTEVHLSTGIRKSIAEGRLSISPAEYPRDSVAYLAAGGTDIARKELLAISTDTKSINPLLKLARNAAGEMQGEGGRDTSMELRIEVSSPVINWFSGGNYHSCPGECGSEAQPLVFKENGVGLGIGDLGAGLAWTGIYRIDEEDAVLQSSQPYSNRETHYDTPTAIQQLQDGKYRLVVVDRSGKTTTMTLHVDPVSPRVEISSVPVAQGLNSFSLYGVVQDTGTGVAQLELSRNYVTIKNFDVPVGTTGPVQFGIENLGVAGDGYYVLKARDLGGTESPLQLLQFLPIPMASIVPSTDSPHNVIGTHVTGISAAGDPCTVTLKSVPLVSDVPVSYFGTVQTLAGTLPAATTVQTSLYSGSEYFSGALAMSVTQKCDPPEDGGYCRPACSAEVQGSSLLGFLLGPKISIGRNSEFGSTAFYDFGGFTAEFMDYQPLPGETPSLTAGGARVKAPPGSVIYPTALEIGFELKLSGASYSSLRVRMPKVYGDISDGDLSRARMLQYGDDGSITDITTAQTRDYIEGVTHHNSIFAVAVPVGVFDKSGPVVSLTGAAPAADGAVYVSSTTRLGFDAVDVSTNAYVLAGTASTYFLLDAEPTPECLAAVYDSSATPGTCANHFYYEAFSATEGVHSLYYQGLDNAGNMGEPVSVALRSDGTPPAAELALNGTPLAAGTTVCVTAADTITLSAADILSNGVVSGLATTYFLIDISPEECDYLEWSGGLEGMGTCENRYYGGPFSLPVGEHVIYFYGEDKVGNTEPVRSITINIKDIADVGFHAESILPGSVIWSWEPAAGATGYQVFAASGGALSGMLSATATVYLQGGMVPDNTYGNYLKIYTASGEFASAASSAVTLANPPGVPDVFEIGQYPAVVIGQKDLVSRNSGLAADKLNTPMAAVADAEGNLWVSDSFNRRVLRFPKGQASGMGADLVIGQADFISAASGLAQNRFNSDPTGIAFDGAGALWVAESCRILRFSPPFSNGMNADLVLGGGNYYSCFTGANAIRPWSIKFDRAGALWVGDWGNNRVLRFKPTFSTGQSADLVLAQFSYPTASGGTSFNGSFVSPRDVAFDSHGRAYVADSGYGRVLVFDPPFYNTMLASAVIGQADFSTFEYGVVSQNRLDRPTSVSLDSYDNLYVADMGNNRVLKFHPPFTNGMGASVVLGQTDFNTEFNLNVSNSFNWPFDADLSGFISSDSDGRLWVADSGNSRVLAFDPVHTGVFSGVDSESFTVNWLQNGNPSWTDYVAEVSRNSDYSGLVMRDVVQDGVAATFTGLSPNSKYYARARAVNSSGVETMWTGLNFVLTKPVAPAALTGVSGGSDSIIWSWASEPGLKYRLFTSTGGDISGVLMEGASFYLQAGLLPNQQYSAYLRAINTAGYADSPVASEVTLGALPAAPEPFIMGQAPAVVLGGSQGTGQGNFSWPFRLTTGPEGEVWVHDTPNCRLMRFGAPQSSGMNADTILGQADFNSAVCGTAPGRIAAGNGTPAYDPDGNLWYADTGNNRIIRFARPLTSAKNADMVIGQPDLYSNIAGRSANKLMGPTEIAFDPAGNMWVADTGNRRVLRFDAPLGDGKAASLVLGQPDFVSNYTVAGSSAYFRALGIAIDSSGNLWVSGGMEFINGNYESRVLRFNPSFSNGMFPSLVMRGTGLVIGQTNIVDPLAVAIDEADSLYVVNTGRILKFDPPFKDGMNASMVLGKDNFISTSGGSLTNPQDVAIYASTSGPVVWVADPSAYRALAYAPMAAPIYDVFSTSMSVKWLASGNPAGTEYKAELSLTRGFSVIAAESGWTTGLSTVFSGLTGNTTYYARVKSRNTEGRDGTYSYLGRAVTQQDIRFITAQSTVTFGGIPELLFTSTKTSTVTLLSTTTGSGAFALAAADGMELFSNIYEIGPDGIYDPPATVVFSYDDTLLPEGLLESDLAVYEHFAGLGWRRLEWQVLDEAANRITVSVTQVASLFGVFGVMQDRTPPATRLDLGPGAWNDASGNVFINAGSSVTLAAGDPVVYGTATGVAYTEYRVDAATSAPFARYPGPFALAPGRRVLEFRSADLAGNMGIAVSSVVYADALPPATFAVISSTPGLDGWQISAATVSLTAFDDMSGVREISYSVDGGTSTRYASPLVFATEGTKLLGYYSVDNVSNREEVLALEVKVDLAPPTAGLELGGVYHAGGASYISALSGFAGLAVTDITSGVKAAYYKVAASTSDLPSVLGPDTTAQFSVYTGTFTLAEGRHALAFGAADNAGHYTAVSISEVYSDGSAPRTTLSFNTTEYASPAGLYVNGNNPVSLAAEDLTVAGVAAGVKETIYSVTASTLAYSGPFKLSDGPAALKYYSVDNTGNNETASRLEFIVDNTAPVSAYAVDGYGSLSGGVLNLAPNSTFTLTAQDPVVNGAASGLRNTQYSLAAVSSSGERTLISSGTYGVVPFPGIGNYELSYLAEDNVLNPGRPVTLGVMIALPAKMSLELSPDTLNVKSQGQYIDAVLQAAGDYTSAQIKPESIKITKINGAALAVPVGINLEAAGKGKYKHVHLGDADTDGILDLSVKFDRQVVMAVLPVGEQTAVTVEGRFSDGGAFSAEGYVRVTQPGKTMSASGGQASHAAGVTVNIPRGALAADTEISLIKIASEKPEVALSRDISAGRLKLRSKGSVYEFGPDGTAFNKPVSISLPCGTCAKGEKPVIGYWNPGSSDWEILASTYDPVSNLVSAEIVHFSQYRVLASEIVSVPEPARVRVSAVQPAVVVLAGPDPEFKPGEVYVYPNPAKGGAAPTLHIECGIADSVNIKIYTVSGREAHSAVLTSLPVALDDGNGLAYAYEYTWRGHIPSGVYYYAIEAEKAGKKIKKTGKFAVVR